MIVQNTNTLYHSDLNPYRQSDSVQSQTLYATEPKMHPKRQIKFFVLLYMIQICYDLQNVEF